MSDPLLRWAALSMATALILSPVASLARGRAAIEVLCRETSETAVSLGLATAIVAVWIRIYQDGCRLGWWAALAAALTGWWVG